MTGWRVAAAAATFARSGVSLLGAGAPPWAAWLLLAEWAVVGLCVGLPRARLASE